MGFNDTVHTSEYQVKSKCCWLGGVACQNNSTTSKNSLQDTTGKCKVAKHNLSHLRG